MSVNFDNLFADEYDKIIFEVDKATDDIKNYIKNNNRNTKECFKKALIENFIDGINDVDDVMAEWHSYIAAEKEKQLNEIITEEKLKADETKKFVDNAIADGEMRTTGTDIDKLMPPISRFGNTNREKKKQTIIEKLKAFFERFFGV